jgi:peptide/nickel transport system permease protein
VSVAWFRRIDNPVMRIMDVLMSLPSLILAIALMGFLGAKQTNLVIAIFLTQLPRMVRVVRSAAIAIRENEYLQAARSLGASDSRIMTRYIFPNALSPIVVQATFLFAQVILIESALSFIGVGTPPPTPSWGNMLAEGREYISIAWWLTVIPGLSIMATVVGLNLLGDGLRDLLDPRLRGQ